MQTDFSQGIGTPCQSDPRIDETRRLVAETARKHGKFVGTTGSAECIAEYASMGYNFINVTADVAILSAAYISNLEKCKRELIRR